MGALSLRLPESIHRHIREIAKKEGVSINQLISTAVAEKLSALLAQEYLEERGQRGNRKKFDRALRKIRDVEPDSGDEQAKNRKPGKS